MEAEVLRELLIKRLKRIEGQVRGVRKMIEEDRDCESIIIQLSAIRSAVEGVGTLFLNNYMKLCFKKSFPEGMGDEERRAIDTLARAIAIWGGTKVGDTP